MLLQGVMLKIKTHSAPFLFQWLCVDGSDVTCVSRKNPDPGLPIRFTLGSRWDGEERYLRMALLYMSGMEGMIYLEKFAGVLLAGRYANPRGLARELVY